MVENAKIKKIKCDILSNFQTMCSFGVKIVTFLLTEKILLTSKMTLSTLSGSQESANTTTMETNNAWVRDCFLIFSRSRFSCICKTKSGCWAAPSLFPLPSPLISNALNTKKTFKFSNFLIKQYEKVSFWTSKPLCILELKSNVSYRIQEIH